MKIREKIKNRIKNRKGMSIGELLFSVLILLLATSVVTATVSLAISNYIRTLAGSEANVLASTLENLMTSELAYTTEIHVDSSGNVTRFQSQNYSNLNSLSMFAVSSGKMVITYPDASEGGTPVKLLSDKSYPNNLSVSMDPITYTYSEDRCTFTIKLTVSRYNEKILERSFQVINVNKTKPE